MAGGEIHSLADRLSLSLFRFACWVSYGCVLLFHFSRKENQTIFCWGGISLWARAEHENTGQKKCVRAFDIHELLLPRIPNDHSTTLMEDAHTKTTHPSLNKATTRTSQREIFFFPKRSSV